MPPRFRIRSNITLRYINYGDPTTNQTYKLPMVNVKLIHKDLTLKTTALIDSGATTNFLPRELAEILLVELTGEHRDVVGAGGQFVSISSIVGKCQLIKNQNSIFDEFVNLPINVPTDEQTLPYMVLGRDSIFRHFTIRFMENDEKIFLRRVS